MCLQHTNTKKKIFSTPLFYLIAIILGIISGMSDIGFLQSLGLLVSDIFIKIFKCISLPIIALSLIVTLSTYSAKGSMKKVWQRAILYTLTTTIIAATVTCGLYLIIQPANINLITEAVVATSQPQKNYLDHVTNLIPSNIFSPFLEHQVMGVLLVGIIVGIAIRYIKDNDAQKTISDFFRGAHGIFLVITRWVVAIIPIGLYGFITTIVLQLREGMDIRGIGEYLLIVVLANLVQGLIILPIWLRLNHIKPFKSMKGMLPALSLAFFSKSSAGTLPVTIECAEKNLKLSPTITRFVLPLATTINMNGCAAFIFATVIYLMQNHGMEVTGGMMVLWIFIATISAVGNAGVPMGCFFLSASLLASMDIPITILGLILPFYSIIDMIETSLNVWSDSCVAQVIHKKSGLLENGELS